MRKPSMTATCEACGDIFHPRPYLTSQGRGRFCSNQCSQTKRMGTIADRLNAATIKSEGCWIYQHVGKRGYGKLLANGKHARAHRVAWELNFGPIPDGMIVCHKCDNPPCVRPDHLFLGTHADNNADRDAKGRQAMGAKASPKNPARGNEVSTAVLTAEVVRCIRDLYTTGHYSQQSIADRFGVRQTTISRVVLRQSWAHIS